MTAANTNQQLIAWKESHRFGVASLDGENLRLAKLINRLHKNMLAGHGNDVLPQVLYHLEASLNQHFAGEEAVLSAHAYPGLDEQRHQHSEFRMKIQEWNRDYRAGKPLVTADILIFLKEWWNNHVLGTDQEYVTFLEANGITNEIWANSKNQ
jgi:hemerythrin-like metal-binding protein